MHSNGYRQFRPQHQYYNQNANIFSIKKGYPKLDELSKALKENKILPGSADLLKAVEDNTFFNYWIDLWKDNSQVEKQVDYLQLIVAAASSRHREIYYSTQNFVLKILQCGLLGKIVSNQLLFISFNENMRNQNYAKIIGYLIDILLAGFELIPDNMSETMGIVHNVFTTLTPLKDNFLLQETVPCLERLQATWMEIQSAAAVEQSFQQHLNLELPRPKSKKKYFVGSKGDPTDNFRCLSIIPTPEDLDPEHIPYLRTAIVNGKYQSDEHYLDVQFRLLREDLIQPLRVGISADKEENNDMYLYKNVQLDQSTIYLRTGDYIHYANIKITRQITNGKAMKYNSLLCLSSDNFKKEFLFATIADRDEKQLKEGKIGLKFEAHLLEINVNLPYCMVESPAFFEAYRHVLYTLQNISPEKPIPFSDYLVQLKTKPKQPVYISRCNYFDFSPVLSENVEFELGRTQFHPSKLSQLNAAHFGMNESQFEAFKYALVSDLAVIQGPPGTGKSYIGLQIAKLLLDKNNWKIWNADVTDQRPLLVVCYTNHALDQFLEGISKFVSHNDIVRVGGRSKNEVVQKFMLANKRPTVSSGARSTYIVLQKEVETLLHTMLKNLKYLIQLENRLASNEALFASQNFCGLSQNCNPALLSDDDVVEWLTKHKRSSTQYPFDVGLIRQLVEWDIPEIKAKNILAYACKRNMDIDAATMYRNLNSPAFKTLPSHLENENSKHWPKLQHIDEIIEMGYPEEVAIELLASVNNNIHLVKVEHHHFSVENARNEQTCLIDLYREKLNIIEEYLNPKDEEEQKKKAEDNVDESENKENENVGESSKKSLNSEKEQLVEKGIICEEWRASENLESFREFVMSAPPMTDAEAYYIHDIWDLPLLTRWRLYQFWILEAQKARKLDIYVLERRYCNQKKLLIEHNAFVDLEILKDAKVVGMTTTGAAKYQSTLRSIKPRIVIAEEAAEVFEAHIVTSLTEACEHLILIGDHQQLRPSPAVYDLAKRYHLDISLFERLIKNGYPYKRLNTQHRMRPEISKILMPHFYQDLYDDISVQNRPHVKGMTKDLFFINHSYPETINNEDGSHKNDYEIDYALKLARYFLQQGYNAEQVTILTTYMEQSLTLRWKGKRIIGEDHGVRIESVDNYQGEESDIIILSLVRSNNPEKRIGFLNISNRVCVALSRAKIGFYVIGNIDFLAMAENPLNAEKRRLWADIQSSVKAADALSNELVVKCQMHKTEQTIHNDRDFDIKCKDGGCSVRCGRRMKCGHCCVRFCHGADMDHVETKCHKPCARVCSPEFQHSCFKECWQECDPCDIEVEKTLLCGHKVVVKCHVKLEEIVCLESCERRLPCKHRCINSCGEGCSMPCGIVVNGELACGHLSDYECGIGPLNAKCLAKVQKEWPICKHFVETTCHVDPKVEACPHPCNTVFTDCGHRCQGTCGDCKNGRLHKPCEEKCKRLLICGHACKSKCYEACPPCDELCQTACGHSRCGTANVKGRKQVKVRFLNHENIDEKPKGRRCGEACPPCVEPCLNFCIHSKCEMKCGQKCNIELCTKPCGKPLSCSRKQNGILVEAHFCIGVCGIEKCLKVCKICNPKEYANIKKPYFGNEQNPDAVFVQLDDCKHIFEVTGLDKYVKTTVYQPHGTDNEIAKLKCPKCFTPIFTSHRYNSYINQQATDLENVKQLLRAYYENKHHHHQFQTEASHLSRKLKNLSIAEPLALPILEDSLNISPRLITPTWLAASENCKKILNCLTTYALSLNENESAELSNECRLILADNCIFDFESYLKNMFNSIYIRCVFIPVSNELFKQLSFETYRFGFMVDLFNYLMEFAKFGNDIEIVDRNALAEIAKQVTSKKIFAANMESTLTTLFDSLIMQNPVMYTPFKKERIALKEVPQKNTWYKNGENYYCI